VQAKPDQFPAAIKTDQLRKHYEALAERSSFVWQEPAHRRLTDAERAGKSPQEVARLEQALAAQNMADEQTLLDMRKLITKIEEDNKPSSTAAPLTAAAATNELLEAGRQKAQARENKLLTFEARVKVYKYFFSL
jgi:hypothetical protein